MALEAVGDTRFELFRSDIAERLDLNLQDADDVLFTLTSLGFLRIEMHLEEGRNDDYVAYALSDRAAMLRAHDWSWDNPLERAVAAVEFMIDSYADRPVKRKTAIEAWERITHSTYSAREMIAKLRRREEDAQ